MKTILSLTFTVFTLSSFAATSEWPPAPWTRITKPHEAEACCDAGGKVAVACKDCSGMAEAKDKKGALSFFEKGTEYECSGCKGMMSVKKVKPGKELAADENTHNCSICGNKSANACVNQGKDAKDAKGAKDAKDAKDAK